MEIITKDSISNIMKKVRNLIVIFSLLMFVGSLTSCTGSRSAYKGKRKTKKKKRCDCPKWSDTNQDNKDEVIALEDCMSL